MPEPPPLAPSCLDLAGDKLVAELVGVMDMPKVRYAAGVHCWHAAACLSVPVCTTSTTRACACTCSENSRQLEHPHVCRDQLDTVFCFSTFSHAGLCLAACHAMQFASSVHMDLSLLLGSIFCTWVVQMLLPV